MRIPFTKVVGAGNDFIVVDTRRRSALRVTRWGAFSRASCDRRNGIGADGVLVLEPSKTATAKMRVINPDGSEAEMCGNGARCVALYLKNGARGTGHGARENAVTIETRAGVLSARVRGHRVAMRMTNPTGLQLHQSLRIGRRWIRYGFVNTGVPHMVVRVAALEAVDVQGLGRALRFHARFAPKGTNVDFIQPAPSRSKPLRIRTYERGVEDETLACGTGVVAAAIIHGASQPATARRSSSRETQQVEVETRSGDVLRVCFAVRRVGVRRSITDVVLEGPAARVFNGCTSWPIRSV